MKSIILISSLLLSAGFFGNVNKSTSELPKYNPKLELVLVDDCHCNGTFCSAAGNCQNGGTCSCSCGVFSCTCTSCTAPPKDEVSIDKSIKYFDSSPVSVSEEQYANIEKVAEILKIDGSPKATEAYNKLSEMIENLNATKYQEYRKCADTLVSTLKVLSQETRDKINNFIASKGSDDKI